MDEDKGKFQYSALKFVYDLELVDDPQLINNMKLNIFSVSSQIKEVEMVASYHTKSMLIWIDLAWLGKTFLKNRIEMGVLDRVQQLLPNFRFRVVSDRVILDLALEKVKKALKGGKNEVRIMPVGDVDSKSSSGSNES